MDDYHIASYIIYKWQMYFWKTSNDKTLRNLDNLVSGYILQESMYSIICRYILYNPLYVWN